LQFGGLGALFGGDKSTKAPRGDGTGVVGYLFVGGMLLYARAGFPFVYLKEYI